MFKLTSLVKPNEGVVIGLAEAAAVYAIYGAALPSHADIRSADPHNRDVEAARKGAAWKAAAMLGLVFLITQDLNSFFIGGLALSGIDYMTKHHNGIHPSTGKLSGAGPATLPSQDATFPPIQDVGDQTPQPDLEY